MLLFNRYACMDILNEGGGGGGSTPPAATTNNTSGVSWDAFKSSLPEDLRNDPTLSTHNNVENFVKSYVHAQKSLGRDKFTVPDKHATPDDWNNVFRKLGTPEKLEDYKFNLPKDAQVDPDTLKSLTAAAHKAGLLPWQMEQIFASYYGEEVRRQGQDDTTYKTRAEADLANLRKEWGEGYDTQTKKANVAFKELLGEADRERLIADGLGGHPVVVKLLANAAKLFKEDVFIGQGEGVGSGLTPAEALQRARDMQGDPRHPYRDASHPNHKQAKKEVADLYKLAFPE